MTSRVRPLHSGHVMTASRSITGWPNAPNDPRAEAGHDRTVRPACRRLPLAYWVAQVCNADARDHRRVAKDGWRADEVVEESNSRAKKNRRDVDVDFVEEASIQQLLDGVGAVDPNGLSGGGGFGLVHGAFDAVGHKMHSRIGSRPSGRDMVGKYECWSPSVISAPALGDVESASTGEHGTKSGRETAKVLGARPGHLERHGVRPSGVDFDVPRGEVPVEHFGHAIVEVGDVAVERHGHDCDNLRHCDVPFEGWRLRSGNSTHAAHSQGRNCRRRAAVIRRLLIRKGIPKDPPVSVPIATMPKLAARAAADPPDEPPVAYAV